MERKGIVTFRGKGITLAGNPVQKGDRAPAFTALANDLTPRSLTDYKGKVIIISAVPSLDTGVCDMQTQRFNQEASNLGDKVQILTISCDLPFAQMRWCGANSVHNLETLSDYRDLSFGSNYGVVIKELRLLTRSIFVINRRGLITYEEIVPDVGNEVNFEAALQAATRCV